MTEAPIFVDGVLTIGEGLVKHFGCDASDAQTSAHLGDMVPLYSFEEDDRLSPSASTKYLVRAAAIALSITSIVRRVPTIAESLVKQRDCDAVGRRTVVHLGEMVPLYRFDDDTASIEDDRAWDAEPEAKTTLGAARGEDYLDRLMADLKAAAATAAQFLSPPTSAKHLVRVTAIAMSITSGFVTSQYLIPGHPRAPAAPSKSFANAIPSVAAPTQAPSARSDR